MIFRFIGMLIFMYAFILFFSLLSEITYKKRSVAQVREDFRKIALTSLFYLAVMIISGYVWHFFVTTTEKSPTPITQNSPTPVFKKSALPSQLSEPEQ
jgi:membrane protease YdiL (CAAX protease family)